MEHIYYVYLLASATGKLYVGMSNNLKRRVWEHRAKVDPKSYTAIHNCVHLVYYESLHDVRQAIAREKQIKKYRRAKKVELVSGMNPLWLDYYEDLY